MNLGPTELIIILVIVLIVFGVGRVSKIGGELGQAVSNFRRGVQENSQEHEASKKEGDNKA
jgi:sec-independent protein translocase protein TatA